MRRIVRIRIGKLLSVKAHWSEAEAKTLRHVPAIDGHIGVQSILLSAEHHGPAWLKCSNSRHQWDGGCRIQRKTCWQDQFLDKRLTNGLVIRRIWRLRYHSSSD